MQLVPTMVFDEDGKPIHHGTVERHYDKLRSIIQMYVLDKQEERIHTYVFGITCSASTTRHLSEGSQ